MNVIRPTLAATLVAGSVAAGYGLLPVATAQAADPNALGT